MWSSATLRPHLAVMLATLVVAALLATPSLAVAAQSSQFPPCMAGNWRLTNVDRILTTILADLPEATVTGSSGEFVLSIAADGSYESPSSWFTADVVVAGQTMSMRFEGSEWGRIRAEGSNPLIGAPTGHSVAMTVTAAGESATVELPFETYSEVYEFDCAAGRATSWILYHPSLRPSVAEKLVSEYVRVN